MRIESSSNLEFVAQRILEAGEAVIGPEWAPHSSATCVMVILRPRRYWMQGRVSISFRALGPVGNEATIGEQGLRWEGFEHLWTVG